MLSNASKIAIAFAAIGFSAVPAYAQAAGGNDPSDIVVTARRFEERLQDVPISITVYNQDQLANRNVSSGQDLAAFTPSLSSLNRFGPNNSNFAIRGFVQDTGTAPSVGVYFGEVVAPRGPAASLPSGDGAGPGMFFDLQNVQVLKGPQGTLFGRSTTGGAVLLVPQKPTDNFEGYVEGSVGNYGMKRVQAVVNIPLADTVRLRIGADSQKRDGYMTNLLNIGPKRFDDINYTSLRASLDINITPQIESYTIANYVKSDTNGHVMKIVAGNCAIPLLGQSCASIAAENAAGFYSLQSDMATAHTSLRQWQISNNTKWEVSDALTLRNIISYARHKSDFFGVPIGTNMVVPANGFGPGYPTQDSRFNLFTVGSLPGGHLTDHSTFTEEFRIEARALDGRLTYQGGFYYEDVKPEGPTGVQNVGGMWCADPANPVSSCYTVDGKGGLTSTLLDQRFSSKAVYSQVTFAATDKISLTAGIRYTWDSSTASATRFTYAFPFNVQNASPKPFLPLDNLPGNYFNIINNQPALIATITRCADFKNVAPPLCTTSRSQKSSAPTWVLGIDYKPTTNVMIYGKYSRGYRTGVIKPDLPQPYQVIQPEKVDTFEIGAKTSFNGAVRGTFNITAFYNNFSNQQVQVSFLPNPGSGVSALPGLANVGKSRIWGIEADTHLNLFEGFTLDAAYAYLNTRVTEVSFPVLPATDPYFVAGDIRTGYPLTLTPNHKLTLTGTYKLPIDEKLGDLTLAATFTYTSRELYSYNGLSTPSLAITQPGWDHSWLSSRGLLNLNLNWKGIAGKPVDLGLFVTNVTNKKYYNAAFGLSLVGLEGASPAEPRMFGARLRVSFGN